MYNLLFYVFSTLLVTSAIGVVLSKNPVYSVFFLIFAFFNAAGIFVMLGAEFIASTLVIVYVGAVAVLFLFTIMMLNINIESMKAFAKEHFKSILMFSILFLAEIILIIYYSDKIELTKPGSIALNAETNVEQIGEVLYTKFAFNFELAGIILFIAMISSIMLTFKKVVSSKRQNIKAQLKRNKENSLKVVKSIKVGQGVDPIIK